METIPEKYIYIFYLSFYSKSSWVPRASELGQFWWTSFPQDRQIKVHSCSHRFTLVSTWLSKGKEGSQVWGRNTLPKQVKHLGLSYVSSEGQTFPKDTYYNSKITLEFDQSTARFSLLRNTVSGGLTSPLGLIGFYLFYYFSLKKLGLDLCEHQIKKYISLWEFIQRTLIIEEDNITMNMYIENAGVNFFCPFPAFYKSQRLNKVGNSVEVILGSLNYITPQDTV